MRKVKAYKITVCLILIAALFSSMEVSAKSSVLSSKNKISKTKKKVRILSPVELEVKELSQSYYYKATKAALSQFQEQSFSPSTEDLDVIFYSIEKRVIYQNIPANEVQYFEFSHLTNTILRFSQILKSKNDLQNDYKMRRLLQMNFYGLSQAIKKANEINLMIQSDQFDKLNNLLVSHATGLFYASYEQIKYSDFFLDIIFFT